MRGQGAAERAVGVLLACTRVRGVGVDHLAGARFERSGAVTAQRAAGGDGLILRERASVVGPDGVARAAWNRERWSVGRGGELTLEHLRFGEERPVRLADFVRWRWRRGWAVARGRGPHVCGADRYWCLVLVGDGAVGVRWRVLGPGARQSVVTWYTVV